jgi:hypothetical protein
MKRLHLLGAAAVAVGALALGAAPASAQYVPHHVHGHYRHYYHHHHGGDVAAGVVGGLAAGALVGAAIAASQEPDCRYVQQRIYVRGVGWRWGDVEVCD